MSFFSEVRKKFAGSLSAFELMDSVAIKNVQKNVGLKCPINDSLEFYVLVELSADNNFINLDIQEFLEKALSEELILDATVADQPSLIQVIGTYKENLKKYIISFRKLKMFRTSGKFVKTFLKVY